MDHWFGWIIAISILISYKLIVDAVRGILLLVIYKFVPSKGVKITYIDEHGISHAKRFSDSDLAGFVAKYAPYTSTEESKHGR